MIWLIILAIIIICVFIYLKFNSKNIADNKFDIAKSEIDLNIYSKKSNFLTPYEKQLYLQLLKYLDTTFPNKYSIFPNVKVSDLIKIDKSKWKVWLNRINQLHIDFVIVNNEKNFEPILAIELDDKSHNLEKRKLVDEKKNKIFNHVGLKLIRIKWFINEDNIKNNIWIHLS